MWECIRLLDFRDFLWFGFVEFMVLTGFFLVFFPHNFSDLFNRRVRIDIEKNSAYILSLQICTSLGRFSYHFISISIIFCRPFVLLWLGLSQRVYTGGSTNFWLSCCGFSLCGLLIGGQVLRYCLIRKKEKRQKKFGFDLPFLLWLWEIMLVFYLLVITLSILFNLGCLKWKKMLHKCTF